MLVGPSEQVFTVHKEVICANSKFFRAACSERWIEGKEKKIKLPDVEASLFRCYLVWVYGAKIDVERFTNEEIDNLSGGVGVLVAKYLELYILGDVLDDVRLRNKVLQTLVLDTKTALYPQTVARVWEKTPDNSPVRRMFVDRAVLRTSCKYFSAYMTEYPESFVQQVAVALLQEVPTQNREIFTAKLPSYLEPVEQED